MHKLWKKGIALAMGAAVVLGSLGLGAAPVKAAEVESTVKSVQYKTTYTLNTTDASTDTSLPLVQNWSTSFEEQSDGYLKMTIPTKYQGAWWAIPESVTNAGIIGAEVEIKGAAADCTGFTIRLGGRNSEKNDDHFVAYAGSTVELTKDSLPYGGNAETAAKTTLSEFSIANTSMTDGESFTVEVKSVSFITEQKVNDTSVEDAKYTTVYKLDASDLLLKDVTVEDVSGSDNKIFKYGDSYSKVFIPIPKSILDAELISVQLNTADESKSGYVSSMLVQLNKESLDDSVQVDVKWGSSFIPVDKTKANISNVDAYLAQNANKVTLESNETYPPPAAQDLEIKSITFVTAKEPVFDEDDGGAGNGSPNAGESPTAIAAADKKAWDDAKAEIDAGTKKEVTVTLKADTTVPKAVLESLAGKDITLKIDLGKGILWTIKGTDVKAADAKDVNLKVTMNAGSIPADTMKAAAKGNDYKKIQLAYDGQFGFKAVLTIKIETKYKGKYAQLFYYNTTDKKMEYISSGKVADDGKVDLTFTHASDYIIVLADQETPKTADVNWGVWVVMLVLAGNMVLLAGYGALLKNKRNIFG